MKLTNIPFAKKLRQFKFLAKRAAALTKSGEFDKLPRGRQMALTSTLRNLYNHLLAKVSNWCFKKWALRIAAVLGLSTSAMAQPTIQFAPPVVTPYSLPTIGAAFTPRAFDFVDIDNDGDLDLFVGSSTQTTMQYCYYNYYYGTTYCFNYYVNRSRVFFLQNTGTPAAPAFAAPVVNPFNLEVDSMSNSVSPQFADIDNDGDYDAFFGKTNGTNIQYFVNNGTAAVPNFGAPVNNPSGLNLGGTYGYGFPKVVFPDINNDGDYDVFSSKLYYGGGNITYQPNNGTAAAPTFATSSVNPFGLVTAYSSRNGIDLVDVDWDGDLDLFAQTYSYSTGASIKVFQNNGTPTTAAFATALNNPFSIVATPGRATDLDFADIDNDGDKDFFTVDFSGIFRFYENISTRGTVQFSTNAMTVQEQVGGVFIPVELSYPDTVQTITVNMELLLTGTATNGQDFTFTSPYTVSFAPGVVGPLYVNIPINNDILIEGTETINLRLANPTPNGIAIGANNNLTVSITDDDTNAPRLEFNTTTMSVNEAAGTISFDVQLTNANSNTTDVTVVARPSSATNNLDYVFASTTVTFPNGSTTPQTVTLSIVDDAVFESTEDIILEFFNPTNGAVFGTNDQLAISILDNDIQPPTIEFANATYTVNENVGTVGVQLNIAAANTNPTNIDLSLSGGGTAFAGLDFTFTNPTTITFPANSTAPITVNIPITDDVNVETQEEIIINLTNPSNGAILGANGTISIFITDNDVSAIGSTGWNENDLRLFPNPVQQMLSVEFADFDNKMLLLMDVNGRQLQQSTMQSSTATVDMTNLPAGTYFVQIRDTQTGKFLTKRVVKD